MLLATEYRVQIPTLTQDFYDSFSFDSAKKRCYRYRLALLSFITFLTFEKEVN